MVRIAPSILSLEEDELDSGVALVSSSGADYIHIDVMDGKFVDNVTNGVAMFKSAYMNALLPIDVHLMVSDPRTAIEDYMQASCITFHIEAVKSIEEAREIINYLHDHNIKAGVAVKPNTKLDEIYDLLNDVDLVLVMTVEPGYGGQKLIPECLLKVYALRTKMPNLDIEVDGGVNLETIEAVRKSGASIAVTGKSFFDADDKAGFISKIRG